MCPTSLLERRFTTMGTEVRVLLGRPLHERLPSAESMAAAVEAELTDFSDRLSRFRPESELTRLNGDPRTEVPASELLRTAVGAGLWAAERTSGLVDPTLLRELEAAGYDESLAGAPSVPLHEALAAAPARRPARANPSSAWRSIEVADADGVIRRPPGVLFDTGGTGKGLAADLLAPRLSWYSRFVIDCGGDVRIGGYDPGGDPIEIEARHPLSGGAAAALAFAAGAVATSGIDARLWRLPDGRHGHHLLDPATGAPAWTGLVGVTARAPTALEADALAKAALLSGPAGAPGFLTEHGGLIVHDSGDVERVSPLSEAL